MITVGSYQAKTHLPRLLTQVSRGEQVTITRHGIPIAMLVPVSSSPHQKNITEAIAAIRSFRKGRHVSVAEIRAAIEEGRP
ncbi:MAG: type II toxin-antitoxin system prevent-host-death family antitoxin [Phycisphaerae bacterium]|nr:type II toxin-antitoxin system prevent-host-death family antitoxin [Phycisphaerae bacterium]